jgi:hypothetical protein
MEGAATWIAESTQRMELECLLPRLRLLDAESI